MSNEELRKELINLINKISDNMALVLILRFVKESSKDWTRREPKLSFSPAF